MSPEANFHGDQPTAWMEAAKCRDLSLAIFFPPDGVGVEIAKRICAECPVIESCLEYALTERTDHGIWGGRSEPERLRMLRRRRA